MNAMDHDVLSLIGRLQKAVEDALREEKGAARANYLRGWNDCRAAMRALIEGAHPPEEHSAQELPPKAPAKVPETSVPRQRENSVPKLVLDIIRAEGPIKGVDIFRAAEARGTPINERTMRTALHRLKTKELICQNDAGWRMTIMGMVKGDRTDLDTPIPGEDQMEDAMPPP